jgi:superfamily I DNA/RNA helicase
LDGVPREYPLHPVQASPEPRIDYAGELNEQQHLAVTAPPGPSLVLAGAGAGKTRTLTYRVAWLIEHGVPADRILLLTFTNKSAREMMQRVAELLGGDVALLWGGTFHSVGVRVLRHHADRLGHRRDFTIADREDVKDLLSACIADSGIDVKAARFPKPEALADLYSMMSNTGRSLEEVSGGEEGARFGPSLMPGGDPKSWELIKPIWVAVSAKVDAKTGKPIAGAARGKPVKAEGAVPCIGTCISSAPTYFLNCSAARWVMLP